MKFIEIDLDGTVVRAKLNNERAPKTCQAVWDALPFEGQAAHAQISGEMFRMLDHTPVAELEAPKHLGWPGYVYFDPGKRSLRICYGEADIKDVAGTIAVTPVAVIDGPDLEKYATKARSQLTEGKKKMTLRLGH